MTAALRLFALAVIIALSASHDLKLSEQDCPAKDEAADVLFLQVDTDISAKERLVTHAAALAELADEVNASELAAAAAVFVQSSEATDTSSRAMPNDSVHSVTKHRKFDFNLKPISFTTLYRDVQQLHAKSGVAASATAMVFGGLMVLVLGCFCALAGLYGSSGSQKPSSFLDSKPAGSTIGSSTTLPARSYPPMQSVRMAAAVPPPILCSELILPNTEARFQIDMAELMDASSTRIPIMSPSGKVLLQAILTEGRVLSILSEGQSTARVLVRRGTGPGPLMLSILTASGASFGKISEGPNGKGLVLYHMNKPSVLLQVRDLSKLDMLAIPLGGTISGPCATLAKSGSSLRLQVRPGQDAILFLASFMSVILIEPKLMEKGHGVSVEEVIQEH